MSLRSQQKGGGRTLVSPSNQIASVSTEKQEIFFSKENLERIVQEMINLKPEFESLPIGIISVSNSDQSNLGKVYTDWLIHYFVSSQDKGSINQWHNRWRPSDIKLKYVGTPATSSAPENNGVYIWPLPFLLSAISPVKAKTKRLGRPTMLLWIIYSSATGDSRILDEFCSSASSTIISLDGPGKNHSIRTQSSNDEGIFCAPTVIEASAALQLKTKWSTETITKSWDQLFLTTDKQPIQPRMFMGQYLTLRTFTQFVEALQQTINTSPSTLDGPPDALIALKASGPPKRLLPVHKPAIPQRTNNVAVTSANQTGRRVGTAVRNPSWKAAGKQPSLNRSSSKVTITAVFNIPKAKPVPVESTTAAATAPESLNQTRRDSVQKRASIKTGSLQAAATTTTTRKFPKPALLPKRVEIINAPPKPPPKPVTTFPKRTESIRKEKAVVQRPKKLVIPDVFNAAHNYLPVKSSPTTTAVSDSPNKTFNKSNDVPKTEIKINQKSVAPLRTVPVPMPKPPLKRPGSAERITNGTSYQKRETSHPSITQSPVEPSKPFTTKPSTKTPEADIVNAANADKISPAKIVTDNNLSEQRKISMHLIAEKLLSLLEDQNDVNLIAKQLEADNGGALETDELTRLLTITKSFSTDLQNMYDNYVCFQGKRDEDQMKRFLQAAHERAKRRWVIESVQLNSLYLEILEAVKTKLFERNNDHNQKIVQREELLVQNVVENVKNECQNKLLEYIQMKNRQLNRSDLEEIHGRLLKQSVMLIGRAMDYAGKLNNVVRDATEELEVSLNALFKHQLSTIDFTERPEISPENISRDTVEVYHTELCKHIDNMYDPTQLTRRHDEIVRRLTGGMDGPEKDDMKLLLDTIWLYITEQLEGKLWRDQSPHPNTSQIGLYLTHKWIWVMTYTEKLGSFPMTFPGANGQEHGFPALVAKSKSDIKWGYAAPKLAKQSGSKPDYVGYFLHHFAKSEIGRNVSQELATDLVRGVKLMVERAVKETTQQILIIIPSWLTYTETSVLRESCKTVGLKRIILLSDSSIAAHKMLASGTPQGMPEGILVLVVTSRLDMIRLEIFRATKDPGTYAGITLLAVASAKVVPYTNRDSSSHSQKLQREYLETVKATYQRASMQLPTHLRNSVRYYQVIADFPEFATSLDYYFRDTEKLGKIVTSIEQVVSEAFSTFSKDPAELKNFVDALAGSTPNGETLSNGNHIPSHKLMKKGNADNELMKRKQALLEKCNIMETQITQGLVPVGRLTRKVIVEAIRRGRLAASEDMVDGAEAKVIDDLFRMHDFKM